MGVLSASPKVLEPGIRDFLCDETRLLQVLWGDEEYWHCDDVSYNADDPRSPAIALKKSEVTVKSWRVIPHTPLA